MKSPPRIQPAKPPHEEVLQLDVRLLEEPENPTLSGIQGGFNLNVVIFSSLEQIHIYDGVQSFDG